MWASGARFEAKLNQYENEPTFSPQLSMAAVGAIGLNETDTNFGSIGANLSASVSKPVQLALPSVIREMSNSGFIESS